MKLQNMAVIFAIIIIPISLLMSMYIQYQIDALVVQTAYDTKLLAATHDAIIAFQSNSLNGTRESYEFNTKRYVLASSKTFTNSLAASLGVSGYGSEELDSFIPALLYTMYDGYYIYTPQERYDSSNDEVVYEHDLKPYVYYSMRYKNSAVDVVINYSLDNYITVCGNVNGNYVSKAGYLLATLPDGSYQFKDEENGVIQIASSILSEPNLDYLEEDIKVLNGDVNYDGELSPQEFYDLHKNDSEFDDEILAIFRKIPSRLVSGRHLSVPKDNATFSDEDKKIIRTKYEYSVLYCNYVYDSTGIKIYKDKNTNNCYKYNQDGRLIKLVNDSAYTNQNGCKKYYEEAISFTEWVNLNLKDLKVQDMCTVEGVRISELTEEKDKSKYSDFNLNDTSAIFEISTTNNPEEDVSVFSQHKRKVMRFLVENDLASSIASYNERANGSYKMPKISEIEWDKILKNISLVSFFEGAPAGTKIYNNYAIVTSTMNTKYVTDETLYYVDEKGKYHLEGCKYAEGKLKGYKRSDFFMRSYYNDTYSYIQHNEIACYHCVVGRTADYKTTATDRIIDYKIARLQSLGREKYNLYKATNQLNLTTN